MSPRVMFAHRACGWPGSSGDEFWIFGTKVLWHTRVALYDLVFFAGRNLRLNPVFINDNWSPLAWASQIMTVMKTLFVKEKLTFRFIILNDVTSYTWGVIKTNFIIAIFQTWWEMWSVSVICTNWVCWRWNRLFKQCNFYFNGASNTLYLILHLQSYFLLLFFNIYLSLL